MSAQPIQKVDADHCPLCLSTDWRTKKELRLYGYRLCKKCYYRQANRRQLAYVVDSIFIWIVVTAVTAILWQLMQTTGGGPLGLNTPVEIIVSAIAYLFFSFRDGFAGQSPGKALLGLQVVEVDTLEPIGFAKSFLRNTPFLAINVASFIAGAASTAFVTPNSGFGFIVLFGGVNLTGLILLLIMARQLCRGPRWGDGLAGTKVVRKAFRFRVPFDTRGLLCTNCGYDLRGSVSGVCSECGSPIAATAAPATEAT